MAKPNGTQTAKDLITRRRFYFVRDEANRPVLTVCVSETPDQGYFRGLSVCHPLDPPCKAKGKVKAQGRADQALVRALRGKDAKVPAALQPTVRNMLMKVAWACNARNQGEQWAALLSEVAPHGELFLCMAATLLTPLERKLFGIKEDSSSGTRAAEK